MDGRFTGTLLDEHDAPVVDGKITLSSRDGTFGHVTTKARGRFVWDGTIPYISNSEGSPSVFALRAHRNGDDDSAFVRTIVSIGEDVTLRLIAAPTVSYDTSGLTVTGAALIDGCIKWSAEDGVLPFEVLRPRARHEIRAVDALTLHVLSESTLSTDGHYSDVLPLAVPEHPDPVAFEGDQAGGLEDCSLKTSVDLEGIGGKLEVKLKKPGPVHTVYIVSELIGNVRVTSTDPTGAPAGDFHCTPKSNALICTNSDDATVARLAITAMPHTIAGYLTEMIVW